MIGSNLDGTVHPNPDGTRHSGNGRADPPGSELSVGTAAITRETASTTRPTFYFDWSPTRGTAAAEGDGEPEWVGALLDWVITRPPGSLVYGETNFEAHRPSLHDQIVEEAEHRGIDLRCLALRSTGGRKAIMDYANRIDGKFDDIAKAHEKESARAYVERYGLRWYDEDDFNAVEAIRHVVKLGRHAARPKLYRAGQWNDRKMFYILRTSGLLRWNNEWVQQVTTGIPSLLELMEKDEAVTKFLGDPPKTARANRLSGYHLELLVGTLIAADDSFKAGDTSPSGGEFERLLGLYEHGYPRIHRSSYQRRVAVLVKREFGKDAMSKHFYRLGPEVHERVKFWRSTGRRASRLLWHLRRDGRSLPGNGPQDPLVGDTKVINS